MSAGTAKFYVVFEDDQARFHEVTSTDAREAVFAAWAQRSGDERRPAVLPRYADGALFRVLALPPPAAWSAALNARVSLPGVDGGDMCGRPLKMSGGFCERALAERREFMRDVVFCRTHGVVRETGGDE